MYIGLDVHKKLSYYSMVDGEEVKKGRFPTTCEGLDEFANELPEGAKVAIEASTSGIFAYEYLDEGGIEVHLALCTGCRKVFTKLKTIQKHYISAGINIVRW